MRSTETRVFGRGIPRASPTGITARSLVVGVLTAVGSFSIFLLGVDAVVQGRTAVAHGVWQQALWRLARIALGALATMYIVRTLALLADTWVAQRVPGRVHYRGL